MIAIQDTEENFVTKDVTYSSMEKTANSTVTVYRATRLDVIQKMGHAHVLRDTKDNIVRKNANLVVLAQIVRTNVNAMEIRLVIMSMVVACANLDSMDQNASTDAPLIQLE